MIWSLIVSLLLTLLFELFTSIVVIGIRNKNDIITVIAVNILTNPIVVFIVNIIIGFNNTVLYWITVIILEIIVVLVEGLIFNKILVFKKISGLKISIINNATSYMLGLVLSVVLVLNTVLKVEAASAFYPITKEIMNEQEFDNYVIMKSTSEVYEDIINGKADIVIVTKPSDEQIQKILNSNTELEFKLLYKEPLAILVNKENQITNMEIEQIQDIYNNSNLYWNTYQLQKNNGSQTCFESIVKGNTLDKNHYEIDTMPKIIDKVANDKKGIAYAFYSYYTKMHTNENAKIIDVNGKNIKAEDYPLLFDVYLVYKKDINDDRINKLIEWLNTDDAKTFIKNRVY